MKRNPPIILLLAFFAVVVYGQTPRSPATSKPAASKPDKKSADYSKEPTVAEQLRTAYRFENDGTGQWERSARIRVQTDAAVEGLGQLVFGYNSANERLDIEYVRVHKPDGSVVTTPPDAVQDLTAPVARDAPEYSDYHQKHVTVPGLRPGDTLEFKTVTVLENPLAPGQFWMEHNFSEQGVVLDEQLEVSVPLGREVKLKTRTGFEPKTSDENGRRIYRWTSSHFPDDEEKDGKRRNRRTDEPKPPAVQLTTFRNWEEVGAWYASLERDRRQPSDNVRKKAAELIQGRDSDLDKVKALYDFVAKDFRYVSLSFGLGRYQPHAASEVLPNRYGDCKDKNTLLAALLDSVGIRTSSVLINSSRKLDPDVPSPSQFDHVITLVPVGQEQVWLDTTTEVAPFQLLVFPLRSKQALVVPPDGPARLMETPADPPTPSGVEVALEGKISELGKLSGHVHIIARGDMDLALRTTFRRVPNAQWKDIAKAITNMGGAGGEVNNVKAGDPGNTSKPFEFEFDFSKANYLDWSSKQSTLQLPLADVRVPEVEDDEDAPADRPVKLGLPMRSAYRLKLELPPNFTARAPLPVSMARDYADYHSAYSLENNILTAERNVVLRWRELPRSRVEDYRAFARAVRADNDQGVSLASIGGATPNLGAQKADELNEAASEALRNGKLEIARDLFKRVVELEPKHKYAWNNLGRTYMAMQQYDDAIAALRKQIEINPYDEYAWNNLGMVYWRQRKYDDATEAFHKQLEVNPLDHLTHANLGAMYQEQHKYAAAAPELEKALTLDPRNPVLQVSLGQAYLNLGQDDKALAAFDHAVELAPSPTIWNNIGYELSKKHVHLDRAQSYAESAVATADAALRNVTLDNLQLTPIGLVVAIGSYWDTLGWVYFQRGDLGKAEIYVRAAWELMQHGEVGDHLGQIYEKKNEKQLAIQTYALALSTERPEPETRSRLAALAGDDNVDKLVGNARNELSRMRTAKLTQTAKEPATAEFFVLFSAGPKVDDVRFISGAENLKGFADVLRSARYSNIAFPEGSQAHLVRRGTLSCTTSVGDERPQSGRQKKAGSARPAAASGPAACSFVLMLPDTVRSVD